MNSQKKHMNVIHEKLGARHLSKTSLDILQTMYEYALLSASTLCRKKRLMTRQLRQHFCRITAISSKTYSRYRPIKYQYLHVCFGMHKKTAFRSCHPFWGVSAAHVTSKVFSKKLKLLS